MPIMYAQPGAIPNTSLGDSIAAPLLGGKAGEGIVAELHGKWYTSSYRGRVFSASALIAGIVIPVQTATAATFVLWNPSASGVNLELISLDLGMLTAATNVVAPIMLGYSNQTPTGLTAITPFSLNGSTGAPQARVASAATITATPVNQLLTLFSITATTLPAQPYHYDFDGKVLVPPGWLVTLLSGANAQTDSTVPNITWAEFPV